MRIIWVLGASIALSAPAGARQADDGAKGSALGDALAACRSQPDATARLECFDRATAALIAARDAGEIVILDREGMRRAKRRVFGFQLPRLALFGGDDDDGAREPEVSEIESTLARVQSVGAGNYLFILADETQWQTTEARSGIFPRAGQPIRIEAGILGSYNAKLNNGSRTVKVKRVR